MGPYCQFCGSRCFLLRVLQDGRSMLMATCDRGLRHDFGKVGETHEIAVNAVIDPAGAAAIAANPQPLTPEMFCRHLECGHHLHAHVGHRLPGTRVLCLACPGDECLGWVREQVTAAQPSGSS